jgi:endonuclease/exonuclease/phosphatase family metal-dependent hydrolase
MNKTVKRILKAAGILLGVLVLIVVAYVAYVVISYHRIEDNQQITADAPLSGTAASAQVEAGESYRITSMNLGFGAYTQDFDFFMDGGTQSWAKSAESVQNSITGAVESLKEYEPDFLMFQELDVDATRSHHVDEYELARSLLADDTSAFAVNYDSAFLFWPLYQPHGKSKAGIALFSEYEITDTLRRSLPISTSFSKFLDLDRCYTINRIAVDNGKELVLINVHLSAYGADESIMEGQREMLFADMAAEYEKGNYVIVGGDFNHDMLGNSNEYFGNQVTESESWAKPFDFDSVPEGFTVAAKYVVEKLKMNLAATCRDTGRAYDGTNDRWILDTFLYSDNIDLMEYDTIDLDFMYSDHNPVYMEFTLKA